MSCLSPSEGPPRSSRFAYLKFIFVFFCLLANTQLFALLFHFLRLLSYATIYSKNFPPRPLSNRASLFGYDLLQFDSLHDDDESLLHLMQIVWAAILAIVMHVFSMVSLCMEHRTTLQIYALVMLVVTFTAGFGALCAPNLIPINQILLPLLGGSVSSLTTFTFALILQQQLESEMQYQQQNSFHNNYYYYNY